MYLLELNDKNFQNGVLESKEIWVVGFGTDWCKPCVSVINNLSALENKLTDFKFGTLDVDKNLKITRQLKIIKIPQVLVLKNGTEMGRFIGYISIDKLEELISHCPGVDDIKSNGKKSSIDT